jgi:hypothetical protein
MAVAQTTQQDTNLNDSAQHKQAKLVKSPKLSNNLKKLTDKDKLGKIAELVVENPISKVCEELGLTVEWSGKKAYETGLTNQEKHESDYKVYYGKTLLKTYEVKNWRNGFNYGCETARTEVINRIAESHTFEYSLIISFLDCFGKPAQELIETYCNNIIETGKLIGSKDFHNRELWFNLYNQIKADLKDALDKLLNYPKRIQQQLTQTLAPYQPQPYQPKPDTDFSMLQSIQSIPNTVVNTVTVNTVTKPPITNNKSPIDTISNNILQDSKKMAEIDGFTWRCGVKIPNNAIEHLDN